MHYFTFTLLYFYLRYFIYVTLHLVLPTQASLMERLKQSHKAARAEAQAYVTEKYGTCGAIPVVWVAHNGDTAVRPPPLTTSLLPIALSLLRLARPPGPPPTQDTPDVYQVMTACGMDFAQEMDDMGVVGI